MLELRLPHEPAERQELGLGLPGKADDEGRPERHPGHAVTQGADELHVGLIAPAATHDTKQPGVGMLQGHVQVAGDAATRGQRVDEVGGDPVRVRVEHPDPADPLHRLERPQERRRRGPVPEVGAIVGRVLGYEVQLDHAGSRQVTRLLDDRRDRPGTLGPAERWDRAEGTGVIAALRDLDVGRVTGCREQPRRLVRVEVPGDRAARLEARAGRQGAGLGDPLDVVQADERVDLWDRALQLVVVPLHHAAGHDETPAASRPLEIGHLEDGLDRLAASRIDEGARVHHDDVGLARIRGDRIAPSLESAEHHLAVDQVLGAAEADHADLDHAAPFVTDRGG